MLSKRIRTIIAVVAVVILLLLALLFGFRVGYEFIMDQDVKASAIASASMQQELNQNTDTEGSEALIGETTAEEDNVELPVHVRQDTPGAVGIFINYGDDSEAIAEQLVEKEVIDDALPFVIMATINGFDGQYQRGTHFVLRGMDYNEIMFNLSKPAETTWVTFPEGSAYIDIKRILRENGVNFDEEVMDELVNSPSEFTNYSFVQNIPTEAEGRIYDLEGYLFPDTYQFDLNASESEIINVLLRNTSNRIDEVYLERAAEIGMTLDEVITLASVIQAESGHIQDQYKISRVFHNRLDNGWGLESDATINYLLKLEGEDTVWAVSEDQANIDNPYNTYMYDTLPPGPISNPGLEAIQAALYPDTQETDLFYFVATGIDGRSAFARNLAEHEQNIATYRENWN